jgi:hypothetical protein
MRKNPWSGIENHPKTGLSAPWSAWSSGVFAQKGGNKNAIAPLERLGAKVSQQNLWRDEIPKMAWSALEQLEHNKICSRENFASSYGAVGAAPMRHSLSPASLQGGGIFVNPFPSSSYIFCSKAPYLYIINKYRRIIIEDIGDYYWPALFAREGRGAAVA